MQTLRKQVKSKKWTLNQLLCPKEQRRKQAQIKKKKKKKIKTEKKEQQNRSVSAQGQAGALLCLAVASPLCEADGNTLTPDGLVALPDHHGAGGHVDMTAVLRHHIQGRQRMLTNPKRPVPLAAMPSTRPRV